MEISNHYNNNPDLKKRGVKIPYTAEQIAEVIKCQQDIVYFLKNYIYILSLDKGRILFEPYDYQIELLEMCKKHRFNIFNLRSSAWKNNHSRRISSL